MKKYIVVTGGAGFIGTNLIELLLKKTQHHIISIDNYSSGLKKNHLKNKKIQYIKSETKNINNVLSKYKNKILVIFHFGEFSRIALSFKNNRKCLNANIIGTYEVVNFCLTNNIRIIYSATSASLGNFQQDKNLSPYAFSKSTNMNLIMNMRDWFGLKFEIIFFYNVYGPKQLTTSKMSAVVGIFENCFLKNNPLPVVLPGTQSRRFTHVIDTVNVCYNAWRKKKNSFYAVVGKSQISIIKLAKLFSKNIEFLPVRKGERFKSNILKSINGRKINNIITKTSLQKYVKDLKESSKG